MPILKKTVKLLSLYFDKYYEYSHSFVVFFFVFLKSIMFYTVSVAAEEGLWNNFSDFKLQQVVNNLSINSPLLWWLPIDHNVQLCHVIPASNKRQDTIDISIEKIGVHCPPETHLIMNCSYHQNLPRFTPNITSNFTSFHPAFTSQKQQYSSFWLVNQFIVTQHANSVQISSQSDENWRFDVTLTFNLFNIWSHKRLLPFESLDQLVMFREVGGELQAGGNLHADKHNNIPDQPILLRIFDFSRNKWTLLKRYILW